MGVNTELSKRQAWTFGRLVSGKNPRQTPAGTVKGRGKGDAVCTVKIVHKYLPVCTRQTVDD